MSAPVNTARVIKHVREREPKIDNEKLIKLAGGSDKQWADYLAGPRVQAIVRECNCIMQDEGYQLASEGIGSRMWQLVTAAEAHRRIAKLNLERIDGAYKRAHDAVEAIALDVRAPKRMREDAKAWLELFEEDLTERGLSILREFADEIASETGKHSEVLQLVNGANAVSLQPESRPVAT